MKELEDFNLEKIQNCINFKAQCYTAEWEMEIQDDINPQFLTRLLTHMRHTRAVALLFQCGS